MVTLKIKEAMKHFNDNRKKGTPRMTQRTLGKFVLPNLSEIQSGWYISRWCKDKELGKLGPTEIVKIAEKTDVSLYFLFGIED